MDDKKPLILVVDDEKNLGETMRDMLELRGFDVVVTINGVEGLKACSKYKIDLILLDLNMPRMDGYMFLENLTERWEKENRQFNLPKIIILTSVDSKKDLGLAHNLGANKFMTKPFKGDDLFAAINELLGDKN